MSNFEEKIKELNKEVDQKRFKYKGWDQSQYIVYDAKSDKWSTNDGKPFYPKFEVYEDYIEIANDFNIVDWYKPDIVWLNNKDKPEDYKGDYYSSKDLSNWFSKPEEVKVIKWIQIMACDNWAKLESN